MINYNNLFNLRGYEVFVVGGNGLIGSQIVKALEEFGAKITVFDIDVKNNKLSLFSLSLFHAT